VNQVSSCSGNTESNNSKFAENALNEKLMGIVSKEITNDGL